MRVIHPAEFADRTVHERHSYQRRVPMRRASRFKWRWILPALTVLAFLAVACGSGDDDDGSATASAGFKTVKINAGEPVKIGISSALSGDVKGLGEPIANAAELAADGKDIKGHAISWVRKDDLCTADGGASAASQLIQEGVVAAVGPICSGSVIAAQPAYERAGITHVSPSSTAIKSTTPDRGTPFVTFVRVTYNDAIQGPAQAEFAREELDAKTAYIVFDTDAYGSGLRDAFRTAFTKDGGKIVGTPEGYEKKQTDFASIVTNIQNAKPDLVYFAGFYAEATPFIKQLRKVNKDVKFLAGDGVKNDEFTKGAGEDAESAYLSLPTPVLKGEVFDKFAKLYQDKFGQRAENGTFVAESYDAATVIINALQKVAKESSDGSLEIDLAKLNEEIRKTDANGAIGKIKFDSKGDNAGGETPVTLYQVKAGKYEEVS
jgi:branched-chain amino acid transport system substrate-binding protein